MSLIKTGVSVLFALPLLALVPGTTQARSSYHGGGSSHRSGGDWGHRGGGDWGHRGGDWGHSRSSYGFNINFGGSPYYGGYYNTYSPYSYGYAYPSYYSYSYPSYYSYGYYGY